MIYEILCNGKVHYTRPEGHPDIAEALALIEWHKKISGVSSYEVRPTKLAHDAGESAVSISSSHASAESTSQTENRYKRRRVKQTVRRHLASKENEMTNLQKIEKLTGGKATLTQQPANDFFPAPHWFLQTADGGRFGATSKRDLLASIAEFLTEQAAEHSVERTLIDIGVCIPKGSAK